MPAYSFQRQFAQPIIDGSKGGTIRAPRQRRVGSGDGPRADTGGHARPGETLYLYTGMRTKQCRKIAEKTCRAVEPIVLNFRTDQIMVGGRVIWSLRGLHLFARFDGFETWPDMAAFWNKTHGMPMIFNGWHVQWMELPDAC